MAGDRKGNKYEAISIYLDTSNKTDMEIYQLLRSSPRGKSKFIIALITHYLEERGIENLHRLTTEEKRKLVENYRFSPIPSENSTQSGVDLLQALSVLLTSCQSLPLIQQTKPVIPAQEEAPKKKGFFKKKNSDENIESQSYQTDPDDILMDDVNVDKDTNNTALMDNWKNGLDMFKKS